MELRLSRRIVACAAAGLLGCASDPGSTPPSAQSAAAAAAHAAEDAGGSGGDPELPADHPYADLRARLEEQRESGATDADALARLRETLARQAEEQIAAQRWGAKPPAGETGSDPELRQLSREIAADTLRRELDREEERLRGERTHDVEEELRKARFEALELAPLRNCVPEKKHVLQLPGDLVLHRTLRRDDFRAQRRGEVVQTEPGTELGAHVAITLLCVTRIRILELAPSGFEARLGRLRYLALLDREQTWWNDAGDHVSEEWTLRHEQVHFDLAEVEARRLTREADAVVRTLVGRGATPEAAVAELQELWDEHYEKVRTAFFELGMQYDRETRHGKELARQTEWFTRAKRGLVESRIGTGG